MTHNNDEALKQIESLQIELLSNPKSLSFARLADLYLAQNMNSEAEELLLRSLKYHPHSVSGHMLLGRIYQLKGDDEKTLQHLNFCINKAPTNWSCYLLRAQVYLKTKKNKLALADFKQVMLHNPNHMGVRKSIARLEVLTADEYDEDLFEIKSLKEIKKPALPLEPDKSTSISTSSSRMERVLSLVDAFTVRQEYVKALKLIKECKSEFGEHAEIKTRLLKLSQFENAEKLRPKVAGHTSLSKQSLIIEKKQKALELLLRRIEESKISQLV